MIAVYYTIPFVFSSLTLSTVVAVANQDCGFCHSLHFVRAYCLVHFFWRCTFSMNYIRSCC